MSPFITLISVVKCIIKLTFDIMNMIIYVNSDGPGNEHNKGYLVFFFLVRIMPTFKQNRNESGSLQ